jgi:hypothetical protein
MAELAWGRREQAPPREQHGKREEHTGRTAPWGMGMRQANPLYDIVLIVSVTY